MYPLKKDTALTIPIFAHDVNGDGVTGLVNGDFTKRISKNGGAFGAMTVTITEMENGFYSLPISTSHSDTNGVLTMLFTASGMKQINLQFRVSTRITDDIPTAAQNATAVLGSTIDGTLDMTESLLILLALGVAKQVDVSGTTFTFKDQSGTTKVTVTYGTGSSTAVIA